FAKRAKTITSIPIMLTGGFETRDQALMATQTDSADAIGLARSMVLNPSLANTWLGDNSNDPEFPIFEAPPRGGVTAWYSMRLTALGEDTEGKFALNPQAAVNAYEERDAQRSVKWQEKYS
ncbi:MAG: oxidoreductase, partial [Rhizobiaceae bacterium]